MTEEEIQKHKDDIDKLSRLEMARMWRFTPTGHVYFQNGPVSTYFCERLTSLGGMSPEISKKIGW